MLMRRMANIDFPENVGVYGAMDRKLKDLLLIMPERERYLVAMQLYLGFRVGYVDYQREARHAGRSKQDLGRLFRLGMNFWVTIDFTGGRLEYLRAHPLG